MNLIRMSTERTTDGLLVNIWLNKKIHDLFMSREKGRYRTSSNWSFKDGSPARFSKRNYSKDLQKVVSGHHDHVGDPFISEARSAKKDKIKPNIGLFRIKGISKQNGKSIILQESKQSESAIKAGQDKLADIAEEVFKQIVRGFKTKCKVNKSDLTY